MLIAIEGIDGSGKGTQAAALAEKLQNEGRQVTLIRFPQYQDTFFGREVGRYLNGDYGSLDTVPVKFSSLLYALDRYQALQGISAALARGEDVICDRYTGSNIAHQAARVPADERAALTSWIVEVEEDILHIPAPDLVVFLDMDVKKSQELVAQKEKRAYTDKSHDLHEASKDHLQIALENFRHLAAERGWARIGCLDEEGRLKSLSVIGDEIHAAVARARRAGH
ncbi:dTMP kinase [Paludibacterium yongneupense]|uniref:dTMP kinase n=1 Tax=Paludibacterium yongneupense TaxID=400061 RepID=UPI00040981B1|nr:dTMP kinase [Paludibacterium yongneupense]